MLKGAQSNEAKAIAQHYLYEHAGVQPCADFQALFWVDENDQIEWVIGYTAFIGKTCQMHMVNLKGGYTPKGLLFGAFDYPFNFLGLEKTFGIVNSQNTKAMEYDKKLGVLMKPLLPEKEMIRLMRPEDKIMSMVGTEMTY